jgi:hypothetical protein
MPAIKGKFQLNSQITFYLSLLEFNYYCALSDGKKLPEDYEPNQKVSDISMFTYNPLEALQ